MARSGSSIETRIAFEGSEAIKKQLQDLASAGEKALSDLQKHFGISKNPFSGLSDGAKEVQRHFDNMATSSQRAGNTVRASLVSAIAGTNDFAAAQTRTGVSSRNLQHHLTNLSFQLNDVFTGLASGQDPMRIFAQQSGQIFQIFQTGGGPRVILGAAASAIKGLISPALLAGTAVAALAVGFGLLIARAQNSEQSAKSFDIQLKALGKSSQASGKDLEEGAKSLRDVGLSADEARDHLRKALNEGVKPQDAVKIVRIGANVSAAMGEGKDGIDRFTAAAGKGGDALRDYAEKLGIIPKFAKEVEADIKRTADAIDDAAKSTRTFNDILDKRRQAISDQRRETAQSEGDIQRQTEQQLKDLTRQRGTAEEEIKLSARRQSEELELQSQRRIVEINRQTNREINALLLERNRENAKKLKEFNDKILADAQEVANNTILAQIDKQTKDAAIEKLSPIGKAFHDLGIAWSTLMDTLSQSAVIQGAVKALGGFVTFLSNAFKNDTVTTIGLIAAAIAGVGAAAFVIVPIFSAIAAGITGIIAGFSALATGAGLVSTGLLAIAAAIGWPAVLLAAVTALIASFVNWGEVLNGTTWTQFLGTMDAFLRMLGAIAGYLGDQFLQVWNFVWGGIKDGFNAVVQFFATKIENVKNWFLDLARTIASAIGSAFGAVSGGMVPGFAAGGLIAAMATGGTVFGPSGTDRVPIWATAGEYMIRKPSVDYLGIGFLDMVNRFPERISEMLNGGHFALGGMIDWQPPAFTDTFARGGTIEADLAGGVHDRISIDLKMPDGEVFGDMLTPRTVVDKFGRYARHRSRVAIGRRPAAQS
jgi:hypothetical protein